jgi:glycosyltransferase involved in cell wall biosynthesis
VIPNRPFISVVVPTHDRPALLLECLDALVAQDYPRSSFEVIVVDDDSPEPPEAAIEAYRERLDISLLRQGRAGPGTARNTAAHQATGVLIAFTDDDCRPAPQWLSALATRHERSPQHGLGGRTLNRLERNLCSVASQLIADAAYANYNQDADDARFFASNNLAFPTATFREVGGFAREFNVASEDRELCDRWRYLGNKLGYTPDAIVLHGHDLTLVGFCRQHFRYGWGARQFHSTRSRRGSGNFCGEIRTHGRFLACVLRGLGALPWRRRLKVSCLLTLWQGVNAAGFFFSWLRTPFGAAKGSRSRSSSRTDTCSTRRP